MYEKPKPYCTMGWGRLTCRSHAEPKNEGRGSYGKTGKPSNLLGRKRETRSALLKENQRHARMYLIDLKGREVGKETRNKELATAAESWQWGPGDEEM